VAEWPANDIEEQALQDQPDRYSEGYKRLVVLLLMTAYTFNAVDRSIISIVSQPMKLDLKLTDTQVGLLGGSAFAVLYAFGGIPLARLAERVSRVNILTVALIIWSSLSALCGAAGSFSQLLLIRAGVGIAEAGCSPPAHSLISDYFEPSRRTSALSIYTVGISLGYLLAALAGGYVAQHWGWRAACAMVGLPGAAIAIVIKVFIREPLRGASESTFGSRIAPSLPPFSLRGELRELCAVGKSLLFARPVLHMVLGVTIGGFAAYGFYAWVPAYFSRTFGLDYTTIGIIAGLAGGVAVGIGIVAGGFVADALAKRDARWYALVPATGGIVALPLYLLAILQANWSATTCLLSLAGFFQYASLGPTFGVVQNVAGRRRRATATALLYICLNVFALGGGPLFTGWVIDRFAQADFHRLDTRSESRSAGDTSFTVTCPGGAAIASANAGIKSACNAALARATRQGMLVTLLFFGWASIHYFLASTGIAKALKSASRQDAAVFASSVQSDST
jgi:predicted MFS family arabinose efflux permease